MDRTIECRSTVIKKFETDEMITNEDKYDEGSASVETVKTPHLCSFSVVADTVKMLYLSKFI